MRRRRRSKIKKEEIAEDYCFVCKDGGLLMVCDYKDCLKAYHPQCVGKEDSFLESDESWSCSWHSCFNCQKASKFQCYVCPKAVCGSCLSVSEFAQVRGKKGFCSHCLKLALLIEDEMDVDSDGGKVDFKDRETYEFLFMEYYEIIKDKEGITAENVHSADALLKKGKNYGSSSDSDELYKGHEEDQLELSDCDDMDDSEGHKRVVRRKSSVKGKATPLKREFIGWGSKVLIEFLASIGQDTTQKLSQYDVTSIISRYVNDNNLLHPQKKRKVLCDERLRPVLGRKSVNKNKIYDIVEGHLAENLEQSEDDEARYSSEDKDETVLMACKRQRKSNLETPQIKELTPLIPQSRFAAIVPKNIKLIYLKRSLMLELLKQPDTFESKVKGSFVKVKADSYWYSQNQTHQLFQVTGIKKTSETQEINAEILLQVPNAKDIRINMLAELDLTEGECEDYRQKVKEGLYKRLTIVELEEKARSLHEDITKHWIEKEISLLQNLIDRANEKGWRRELFEYLDRKQLLMSSTEQSRLLNEVPKAIPDIEELEPASGDSSADDKQVDNGSPRTILIETTKTPSDKLKGKGYGDISNKSSASGIIGSGSGSDEDGNKEATDGNASQKDNEGDGNNKEHSADEIVGSDSASDINGKGKTTIGNTDTKVDEEKQQLSEASEAAGSEELFQQCQQSQIITPVGRSDLILQKMSRQMTSCFAGEKQMAPVAEFIELSDDDDEDDTGDSSVDAGNNNRISTVLKSNFEPYGRDFTGGRPTGRFSNGRIPPDFISEAFGLKPTVPAYLDPNYNISDFATGVCFASAGTGYDNQTSDVLSVIPLWKELEYYKEYQEKLRAYLGQEKANEILSESLYLMSLGTNDFLENYYIFSGRSSQYTVPQYEDFLVGIAGNFIKEIYSLGARKVSLGGLPPMGCLPLERTTNFFGGSECIERYNNVAMEFNGKLNTLVGKLNKKLPGIKVVLSNPYFILQQIIRKPSSYGYENAAVACCATGMFEMGYLCNRYNMLTCPDASKYVFWDSFHPTEKTNGIISDHVVKTVLKVFL